MKNTSEKKSIIFYGAGNEARLHLAEWEAKGLIPTCFADMDGEKHYTKIRVKGGCCVDTVDYDILPLDVALAKYPDYIIYVTVAPQNLMSVTEHLLAMKIPADRISYAGSHYVGLGCEYLGKEFVLYKGVLTCAIAPLRYFGVEIMPDINASYQQYRKRVDSFVLDNMRDQPSLCKDCFKLRLGTWEIEPRLTAVNISSDPDDFCNSQCVYCEKYPNPTSDNRRKYILDTMKYFTEMAAGERFTFHISAGEMSISPYCDEALRLICENENLYISIATNAIVFNQSITDALGTGRLSLMISLDSGTRETMKRVRGIDCFEQSIRNCGAYAMFLAHKTMLSLKFILMEGVNDNEADIRGFLDIVKNIGCVAVLSTNWRFIDNGLSEHGRRMCFLFMCVCSENSLMFDYIDYYFHEKDRSYIEDMRLEIQL